ncbi:hypothetical protein C8J56DRAFT_930652 [Mycena floridula]|nr:hypothetical protein C8J56DRAFT_930652 [Mycena floridula]
MTNPQSFQINFFWQSQSEILQADVLPQDNLREALLKVLDLTPAERQELAKLSRSFAFVLKEPLNPKDLDTALNAMGELSKSDKVEEWTLQPASEFWDAESHDRTCVHVILPGASVGDGSEDVLGDLPAKRIRFFQNNPSKSPSLEGETPSFSKRQNNPETAIYCGRPAGMVQPVPPILLHPDFSTFMDDLVSCSPTPQDVDCFHRLQIEMRGFFPNEASRMSEFRSILEDHGFGSLDPLSISGFTTAGGRRLSVQALQKDPVLLLIEGKNEVGHKSAEPMLQNILYFLEVVRDVISELNDTPEKHLHTNFPVVMLQAFGPYIAIALGVFNGEPNVQIISPVLPLYFHPTDLETVASGERFICALRLLLDRLASYYETDAFDPNSKRQPEYPFYTTFTCENLDHEFVYDGQIPDKRLFKVHGVCGHDEHQNLIVKFTKQYSEDAHNAAFKNGFAPKLIAVNQLKGGWLMVVMQDLSVSHRAIDEIPLEQLTTLDSLISKKVQEFHDEGFVHGNLRLANIMLREAGDDEKMKLVLVDFDWSGPEGSAKYPSNISLNILRPKSVSRGGLIIKEQDEQMLQISLTGQPNIRLAW